MKQKKNTLPSSKKADLKVKKVRKISVKCTVSDWPWQSGSGRASCPEVKVSKTYGRRLTCGTPFCWRSNTAHRWRREDAWCSVGLPDRRALTVHFTEIFLIFFFWGQPESVRWGMDHLPTPHPLDPPLTWNRNELSFGSVTVRFNCKGLQFCPLGQNAFVCFLECQVTRYKLA